MPSALQPHRLKYSSFLLQAEQRHCIWSFLVGDVLQAARQPPHRVRPGHTSFQGAIPRNQVPDLQPQLCPCRVEEKGSCPRLASSTCVRASKRGVCLCLRNTVLPGVSSRAGTLPSHLASRLLPSWVCPSCPPDTTVSYKLVPARNCTLCFSPSHPTGSASLLPAAAAVTTLGSASPGTPCPVPGTSHHRAPLPLTLLLRFSDKLSVTPSQISLLSLLTMRMTSETLPKVLESQDTCHLRPLSFL